MLAKALLSEIFREKKSGEGGTDLLSANSASSSHWGSGVMFLEGWIFSFHFMYSSPG